MGGTLVDGERLPLKTSRWLARRLIKEIETRTGGILFVGGSVARGDETCGDIDAVFLAKDNSSFAEFDKWCEEYDIKTNKKIRRGIYQQIGKTKEARMQVDFWIADETNVVTMLNFVNGSGWFNGTLRSIAKRNGLKLSQLGVFEDNEEGRQIAGKMSEFDKKSIIKQEAEVFAALKHEYVPLKERSANNRQEAMGTLRFYRRPE